MSLPANSSHRALLLWPHRNWRTTAPFGFMVHLEPTGLRQCPETLFVFCSQRRVLGQADLGAPASFWKKQETFLPPREKPIPSTVATRWGCRGSGHPHLPSPGSACCTELQREATQRVACLANFLPSMGRRQQMRQNEKYNDAYYINHPPFF